MQVGDRSYIVHAVLDIGAHLPKGAARQLTMRERAREEKEKETKEKKKLTQAGKYHHRYHPRKAKKQKVT